MRPSGWLVLGCILWVYMLIDSALVWAWLTHVPDSLPIWIFAVGTSVVDVAAHALIPSFYKFIKDGDM